MNDLTTRLTDLIDAAPAWAVYVIACGVVYLETAVAVIGLVAPSEAILIAAGVVAAIGKPSIVVLVLSAAVAALAGDATGYWVGRLTGPRLARTGLGRRLTHRVHRSGYRPPEAGDAVIAIASARWVGYLRSLTPLLAGSRAMPFHRYLLATALGGTTWTATILLVSFGVGATLGARVALIVGLGVAFLAFCFLLYRRLRSRPAG
ncbi:DedA family protein [Gordonia hydrophobica]|uniref:VTT domain-containing protein n=1 Tax=Gordonia hydrophobica TaxID=40516 RepID=A0ABZ2U673_9ACTN|nr:VTT domain-containing protein [Gordonia hydrophobica]MBM7368744.1 membrane-associated protein [Gordonia hydrophobica]